MEYGYAYKETIANGLTGDTIKIPVLQAGKTISICLIAGSNTGKIQVTTSSDADVAANTATWSDLVLSANTGTVRDEITAPITGLRGVSTSGEISIEVVI
jgi:hypothetical protein